MTEPDSTIRFKPDDVPELQEIQTPRKRKPKKREVPGPTDWMPFGVEW